MSAVGNPDSTRWPEVAPCSVAIVLMGNCEMCDKDKEREVEQDMTRLNHIQAEQRVGLHGIIGEDGGTQLGTLSALMASANPREVITERAARFRTLADLKSLFSAVDSQLSKSDSGRQETVFLNKLFEVFLETQVRPETQEDLLNKALIQRVAEQVLRLVFIGHKYPKEDQNKMVREVGASLTGLKTELKPLAVELAYVATARGEYERILQSIPGVGH